MKGRLKIVNETSYPTDEVEQLVRFGLDEIEVTGKKILAIISRTRSHAYRGWAGKSHWFDEEHVRKLAKQYKADYVIRMLLGKPEQFPILPFSRNGVVHDYRTWQEALVGITAHEGCHVQHYYDGTYQTRSGRRKASTMKTPYGEQTYRRAARVRVGIERVEPKCEAFEAYMTRRYRAEMSERLPEAAVR